MFKLRTMVPDDFDRVADLIFLSTNSWYQQKLGHPIFTGKPEDCRIFCDVYEDLDPECGIVAEHTTTGALMGSCFYHARETHVSLGIMNVHPNYFGAGVASSILQKIIEFSDGHDLPLRLVSSAMNLDSFSLYNRFGFVPFGAYQDMYIDVPKDGLVGANDDREDGEEEDDGNEEADKRVREAELRDLLTMGQVEFEVSGISRERDYCYFIENDLGIWHTMVSLDEKGKVNGFLVSSDHPASSMIGPGVAKTPEAAEALLWAQLDRFRGRRATFLLPVNRPDIVQPMYELGAKNCEIHFSQVRGESQPVRGIVMPGFLPETA